VHVASGPVEVARHQRATPGSPQLIDAHFPPASAGALARQPKARNAAEAEFLALGGDVRLWLTEAAAAGTANAHQAVRLAKLGDPVAVDWALGHAAVKSRFAEAICPQSSATTPAPTTARVTRPGETRSLTQGTPAWSALHGRQDGLPPNSEPGSDLDNEVGR